MPQSTKHTSPTEYASSPSPSIGRSFRIVIYLYLVVHWPCRIRISLLPVLKGGPNVKLYRKLLFTFVIAAIVGFFIHLLLFFINIGIPMEKERYLNEWLLQKDTYAHSCKGRKIMFISGSNTLFGVDTQQIETTLEIPTVNYGTHAALRYYNLERGKKHLHSGDIVVLPLEYPYYIWHHDMFETEMGSYLLGYDPAEIEKLTLLDKLKFIAQQSTKDLVKFTCQRMLPPPKTEGAYSSQYLNTNGDMTNNHMDKKLTDSALQSKISNTVFSEQPLTTDAKEELSSFIAYCHDNDITIYAAWPNYLWRDKEFTDKDLEGVHAIEDFYHSQNIEILGNYTDCLYDADLFYDSTYHLNEEGKRIHTDYLINLLKDKLPQQ